MHRCGVRSAKILLGGMRTLDWPDTCQLFIGLLAVFSKPRSVGRTLEDER